jgi:hypothetical protein
MSFNQFSSSFLFFTVPGPIKGNRGPGANFCFGGLIFPKNVGEWGGGGGNKFFQVPDKFLSQHRSNPFFGSIYVKF